MEPLFSLPDYKQTNLVQVLRLIMHRDCISRNAVWQRPMFPEILDFNLNLNHKKMPVGLTAFSWLSTLSNSFNPNK